MRAKDIFLDALDVPPAERAAWVAQHCADPALRAEVMSLLAAHDGAPDLVPPAVDSSLIGGASRASRGGGGEAEAEGERIGHYELLRRLGEGGFGVVYLARQHEPVVRDVALKVLKSGMDSAQVVARFETERQTLARMDHPHIARVFDAGTSERGRPYFVMEFVDGQPITTYCDDRKLDLSARLALLEQVCLAVQHAHQKGVIHRDLKPGNILVSSFDGKPVPKVIDFGIAKAVDTEDGELRPSMTLEAQIIGTPQYMAPEQAIIGPKNVDTRSDVYSLGTVLYELITGSPPFDPTELRRAGLEQICKIVRERTPAKPSTRLSEAAPAQATAAAARMSTRSLDLSKLRRQVAGEVDWIVMKALEKEPSRRYQSAESLAADIRRYLNHEPVEARPPSRIYQLRKFVRRHRLEVSAAAVVAVALVTVAAVATIKERQAQAARLVAVQKADEAARELAKANAIAQFTERMFQGIGPSVARGRDTALLKDILEESLRSSDERMVNFPELDIVVRSMIGRAQFDLGDFPRAIATLRPLFERMRDTPLRDNPDRLRAGTLLGTLLGQTDQWTAARDAFAEACAGYERNGDSNSYAALQAKAGLADATARRGDAAGALSMLQDVGRQLQGTQRGETELALLVRNSTASRLMELARTNEAVAEWEQLLSLNRRLLGSDHPGTLATLLNLAGAYSAAGDHARATDYNMRALETGRRIYESGHPFLVPMLNNLAAEFIHLRRLDDADKYLTEARSIVAAKPEACRRYVMALTVQLLDLRRAQGRTEEAVTVARELRDLRARELGRGHVLTLSSDITLVATLCDAGRFSDALERVAVLGAMQFPAELEPQYRIALHAAAADAFFGLGKHEDARREVARARAIVAPAPKQGPPVSPRLIRVEAALASLVAASAQSGAATSQPTTAPATASR